MYEPKPYTSSTEQVRDLLELVRLHLLHRETVLNHAATGAGVGQREVVGLAFLTDNIEPHRIPMTPVMADAYRDCMRHIGMCTAMSEASSLRFSALAAELRLGGLEQSLLLTAIAPHFSRGFHHAFDRLVPGFEAGRIPRGALADLVALSESQRWSALDLLHADQRLVKTGLLLTDLGPVGVARPDGQVWMWASPVVLDYLLRGDVPAARPSALGGMARYLETRSDLRELPLAEASWRALTVLAGVDGREGDRPNVAVVVTGGLAPNRVAEALAFTAERDLVLLSWLAEGRDAASTAAYRQVALFARLHDTALVVELMRPTEVSDAALAPLFEGIIEAPQIIVASTESAPALARLESVNLTTVHLPALSERERRWAWTEALGDGYEKVDVGQLAASFALAEREIREVVRSTEGVKDTAALARVARKRLAAGMEGVAERIETHGGLHDLVVSDECRQELEAITAYVTHVRLVERRFEQAVGRGRGTSALFYGPSGTGKTFAAAAIARLTGRDLYRIDLAQVVDKYIGETEKKLDRVFTLAEASDSIILFDEADSLFAKRQDGGSSGDRFANMQVNFLLQRMESYAGMSILTTNLLESIDTAFRRRIQFQVHFAKPAAPVRAQLWQQYLRLFGNPTISPETIDELAEQFDMSGAHIRNAVIKAAVLASSRGIADLRADLLVESATREYRAIGGLVRARPT